MFSSNKVRTFVVQSIILLTLIVFAIILYYPIMLTFIKAVKTQSQDLMYPYSITFPFNFENYKIAWAYISPYVFNSLYIAVLDTAGTLVISALTAYGFSRFNFYGKKIVYMAMLALIMLPGILTLVPKYLMLIDFGFMNSPWGIILPGSFSGLPFRVILLNTFFRCLPRDLFEAAELDGAGHLKQFRHVMIPMCMPILATVGINNFLGSWNGVLWPKLILTKEELFTIPIGLTAFTNEYQSLFRGTMGAPLAGYVIAAIPLIIVFMFASKQFIKGLTSGAFKL